ncbi:hypothetical protein OAF78_02460 [Winogradskyella sp.]|nr:hypothetical protein [Winogradskyella sp.]MDB4752605.1 hypothetical protein [Winogradskyella sp.]
MKFYITLLFFILLSNSAFSQDNPGNLQFNRVVNESGNFSDPTGSTIVKVDVLSFTIPEGKIWKVTSTFCVGSNGAPFGGTASDASAGFYKAGDTNPITAFVRQSGFSHNQIVWLSEGAYTFSVSVSRGGKASFTALEFNIIPAD